MNKTASWLVFSVAVVYLGCNIDFEEPVYNPPEISVDPAPYLGEWDLASMSGEQVELGKYQLSVAQIEDATLTVTTSGEGKPGNTYVFRLTLVNQKAVASVEHATDAWRIFRIELREEGSELVVKGPNYETVKSDVLSDVIPGQVQGTELGGLFEWIDITASPTEVRTYLEERPQIFVSDYVFARPSP
jgi:hypothetical protein